MSSSGRGKPEERVGSRTDDADSTRSIAEISYAVGFAEVSAFHRAFKRWTGSTPTDYRQSRAAS